MQTINRGKIIKITDKEILIAGENNIIAIPMVDINFNPRLGDLVEVYEYKGEFIINKIASAAYFYYETHKVNKIAYVLFAIFLGGIGAHKFYAGSHFKGIIYVLFCWSGIPSLIGVIEGIVALFKTSDQAGNIIP